MGPQQQGRSNGTRKKKNIDSAKHRMFEKSVVGGREPPAQVSRGGQCPCLACGCTGVKATTPARSHPHNGGQDHTRGPTAKPGVVGSNKTRLPSQLPTPANTQSNTRHKTQAMKNLPGTEGGANHEM